MDKASRSSGPVLYVIVCGAPAARGVPDFIRSAQVAGWCVCAIPTPAGVNFVDTDLLKQVTGYPVRTHYKHPSEHDVLPPADAYVVAPATFNTVNKIAHGITDTLGVGLVCEALGFGKPVIVVPALNRGLACAGPYGRSLELLASDGARVILTRTTSPSGDPAVDLCDGLPWDSILEELSRVR